MRFFYVSLLPLISGFILTPWRVSSPRLKQRNHPTITHIATDVDGTLIPPNTQHSDVIKQRNHPTITHIATDVDGTLIPPNTQKPNAPSLEYLRDLHSEGKIEWVLATGKTREGAIRSLSQGNVIDKDFLKSLNGVFLQGLVVYKEGKVLRSVKLAPCVVKRVEKFVREKQKNNDNDELELVAYCENRIFSWKGCEGREQTVGLSRFYGEPVVEASESLNFDDLEVNKLIVFAAADRVKSLRNDLAEALGKDKDFSITQALPTMLEVLPPDGSKEAGLRTLIGDLDHVLAIGDAENDIEMLRAAGRSFVCSDAAGQIVKEAAEFVVDLKTSEGGVKEGIRRVVN